MVSRDGGGDGNDMGNYVCFYQGRLSIFCSTVFYWHISVSGFSLPVCYGPKVGRTNCGLWGLDCVEAHSILLPKTLRWG